MDWTDRRVKIWKRSVSGELLTYKGIIVECTDKKIVFIDKFNKSYEWLRDSIEEIKEVQNV